jgi:NAD(P)-dependent dehydrogenase (short-subunit alcohol dehydrogenase family)
MLLKDKVVLVTGGSSGIGRAAVRVFAAHGARLVVASRHPDPDVAEIAASVGSSAEHVVADVTRAADVERLVDVALAKFGRLDGAFNNAAAGTGALSTLPEQTEATFDEALTDNLKSVWLCMRAELRAFAAAAPTRGAIVNMSSVNGLGAAPGAALYSAGKAGVIALSKGVAIDTAAQGIRVNVIAAGAFATPMLERMVGKLAEGAGVTPAQVAASYQARIPMGRLGDAAEAAEAAAWLLSDAASYVTGSTMVVDGGLTAFAR